MKIRGLTLVEVVVASAVLGVVMLMALITSRAATLSMTDGTAFVKTSTVATRGLDRLSEDLTAASIHTVAYDETSYGDAATGYGGISFQKVIGYNYALNTPFNGFEKGTVPYHSPARKVLVIRYRLQSGESNGTDGIDNDNDGLIDEGCLVRQEIDFGNDGEPGGTGPDADITFQELIIADNLVGNAATGEKGVRFFRTDSEDSNDNNLLDPGEDNNNNGVLDKHSNSVRVVLRAQFLSSNYTTEDSNGNGLLDSGEDRNNNGVLDLPQRGGRGVSVHEYQTVIKVKN